MTVQNKLTVVSGRLLIGTLLVLVLVFGNQAVAQVIPDAPARVRQSLVYLTWDLDGDSTTASISEWIMPVSGMIPLSPEMELRFFTALAGATSSDDEFERDLSGLTDTRFQLVRALADQRFLVSVGINLPTGKKKLNTDQFEVLRVLSAEQFNFPIKTFGEGFGAFGEFLGAAPAGNWVLTGGIGAFLNGSYEPGNNGISYRPGSRIYLTGAADRPLGADGRFRIDGVVVIAGTDQAEVNDVFKDGAQIDFSAVATQRWGIWQGAARARTILRGKDERLTEDGVMAGELHSSSGSELRLFGQLGRELSDKLTGFVDLSGKFSAANDYPVGDPGYEGAVSLFGLGGKIAGTLSERTTASLGVRKWFGSADEGGQNEALDLGGWEIMQSLTISF